MSHKELTRKENIVWGIIMLTLLYVTAIIGGTIATMDAAQERQRRAQFPAIEQCDLPLWDRIRFKCP